MGKLIGEWGGNLNVRSGRGRRENEKGTGNGVGCVQLIHLGSSLARGDLGREMFKTCFRAI
jgi:hypothetical protein